MEVIAVIALFLLPPPAWRCCTSSWYKSKSFVFKVMHEIKRSNEWITEQPVVEATIWLNCNKTSTINFFSIFVGVLFVWIPHKIFFRIPIKFLTSKCDLEGGQVFVVIILITFVKDFDCAVFLVEKIVFSSSYYIDKFLKVIIGDVSHGSTTVDNRFRGSYRQGT